MKKELKKKLNLSYNLILLGILETEDNKYNSLFNELLNNFEEITEINKLEQKKIQFFYFLRNKVHDILYEKEEIIKVDNNKENINLSSYFYLDLLINENNDIVNYEFSLTFIQNINKLRENIKDDNYKKKLLSKIIKSLIYNYKGNDEYNKEKEKELLDNIENENNEIIKNDNLYKKKKIDLIYSDIIINLIKGNKIDDYENTYNIINQLDLENINITKTMFDELSEALNINEDYIKKYIIKEIKDLYNKDIINFYYILFKYILKNSIYIYHIPFLSEIRKNVLKFFRQDSSLNNLLESYKKISDKNNKEKIEYIIKKITDTDYYFEKYIYKRLNNDLQIIKVLKILSHHERQAEFIKELNNGYLISTGSCDELFLYKLNNDNNYEIIKDINEIQKKKEKDKLKEKEKEKLKEEEKQIIKKWILNVNETTQKYKKSNKKVTQKSNNKEKIQKNQLMLITCSKLGLKLISINNSKYSFKKYDIDMFKNYINTCSFFFELKNDNYIFGGEKGVQHILVSKYNDQTKIDIIKETEEAFRCGIKINEDIFAFSSNSILPNGKDILIFYNITTNEFKEINGYSFTVCTNNLALMTHRETSSNVLLCGCKQYKKNQKNGILLIELNSYEEQFFDTNDFEVFCFCPISIDHNYTNYFLVGGFEKDKNQGLIKLYKIIVIEETEEKEEKKETKEKESYINLTLEFIENITIDHKKINKFYSIITKKEVKNEGKGNKSKYEINISYKEVKNSYSFSGFNRTISCIIQSKKTGKILITSWDGNVYLFSQPNINHYLEYDKFEYVKNEHNK